MSAFRPRLHASAASLLIEGYRFGPRRFGRAGTDQFRTRLAGLPAIVARGEEAAALVYGPQATRRGALPPTVTALLQDRGSVQTLDGPAHHHRKALFLELTTGHRLAAAVRVAEDEWRAAGERWAAADQVVLLPAVETLLTRVALRWAGVPGADDDAEVARRAAELAAMVHGAGSVGLRNLRGEWLRHRSERWARLLVADTRSGDTSGGSSGSEPDATPLQVLARHRDPEGRLLTPEVAGVELLNLLRPIVAVAHFVVFSALALHTTAGARAFVADGDDRHLLAFVQEVRRTAPFFPVVGGRLTDRAELAGQPLPAGRRVILDLYGTNHHPDLWPDPDRFDPGRFLSRDPSPFDLVPQGAGDVATGHRCPGETLTIELMKVATRALVRELRYDVPPQDLRVPLSRMPARPNSGFVLRHVVSREAEFGRSVSG